MDARLWSKRDLDDLLRLWIKGLSPVEIGAEIGRTKAAIMSKASRIGLLQMTREELAAPGVKLRWCLYGGHDFVSASVGNRICSGCKQSDVYRAA
ncbi:hypothetical protein ABIA16_003524 [Sinorhizobium fredii]